MGTGAGMWVFEMSGTHRRLMTEHWAVPVSKKWAEEEETAQETDNIASNVGGVQHCCAVEAKG